MIVPKPIEMVSSVALQLLLLSEKGTGSNPVAIGRSYGVTWEHKTSCKRLFSDLNNGQWCMVLLLLSYT